MTDHFPRPSARASAAERVAELHQLARDDYAKGASQRLSHRLDAYLAADTTPAPAAAPSDLDVAISVAQQLLDSDQVLSLREALRLLLRAIGAEPNAGNLAHPRNVSPRCPAAHRDDPTPCVGPTVVAILDATNAGAEGCEHHAARLLASLERGRVYPLPAAPEEAAIRVFKAAGSLRPFCWYERGENR